MDVHAEMLELLGAWALDACDDNETAAVEAHLRGCPSCADEARRMKSAAGWLGVEGVRPPPAHLRRTVLTAARRARPPRGAVTLLGAYSAQVARLDRLLTGVSADDWLLADPRHDTVRGVVAHLARNDGALAADLGLRVVAVPASGGAAAHAAWREQTEVLAHGLAGGADLDRPVRLAGPRETPVRPLREALVQRAFETWTHLDDIGAALGQVLSEPPPEQVRRIVDLAVGLLPTALRAQRITRPGASLRLALAGGGGGEWRIPLGDPGAPDAAPVATVEAEAVEFARLVANRRPPQSMRCTVVGDGDLAGRVLRVAAMLGCD